MAETPAQSGQLQKGGGHEPHRSKHVGVFDFACPRRARGSQRFHTYPIYNDVCILGRHSRVCRTRVGQRSENLKTT